MLIIVLRRSDLTLDEYGIVNMYLYYLSMYLSSMYLSMYLYVLEYVLEYSMYYVLE